MGESFRIVPGMTSSTTNVQVRDTDMIATRRSTPSAKQCHFPTILPRADAVNKVTATGNECQ